MSDASQGPGWWQASDLKWYPPAPPRLPPPPRQPWKPSRFSRWLGGLSTPKQLLVIFGVLVVVSAIAGVDDDPGH